jgi:tRNA modification GTPase
MSISFDPNDTIAAVASPPGPSARGVVRLSGPQAWPIVLASFVADRDLPPPSRPEMRSGSLKVDGLRPHLPVMLSLWPAPRTYTGQDVAEIHLVGSPPLVSQVLAHCVGRGARQAEPGEFTLRAFLSGRIDLTRAEAVLGVIDAANPAQLDAALQQLAGGLSGPILALRNHLLDVIAHLEANLDFTEEPDVDPLLRAVLADELDGSARELQALARRLDERDRPDGYPRVALVGPPNAGKSRLFNALLGREQAIVSPQAGTTRDYLTALCDCDGLTIELVDTAGIESASDAITIQAQAHRADQAARADLLLDCRSADTADPASHEFPNDCAVLSVLTKCDLAPLVCPADDSTRRLPTSAATGEGIEELRAVIARRIRGEAGEGSLPAGTSARCRGSILRAEAALRSVAESIAVGGGDELVAFDLRLAVEELGKIVGAVVTDDILDRIFRRFCIGK